ncbi:MAG TPA: ATP synthase subunit I [Candidatus Thiothrix moscowensis]|uniref:ATP synthase subunit I n=1 Tax=unclassified Thiothrix TaxID=2636184 RepID=UPI001A33741E|nr:MULTISPECIES: ATP synthase subunit I [unclassified Thiothrix]MBJ6609533.1 ATP synthase subunit I [Candidatus Thiothrix moscowensis]HRJ51469.1 ATP synthase subunit I [Candidatus Thiothrix moscowensis]HRJ91476.1 ATP synthase subunit I [Candidatus Thiothrix moscowensis]
MRNVLIIQAILILAGAAVSRFYQGDAALLPAFYGGAVALANTMLLSRRVAVAGEIAKTNPERSVYALYFGVVQRFVFVLVALGFGLGYLELTPVPLLGTFMVAQLAYMLMGTRQAG